MGDEHTPLLFRQFIEPGIQFFKQQLTCIESIRAGLGRWQQVLPIRSLLLGRRSMHGRFRRIAAALPKQIRDPVSCYPKQPSAHLLERLGEPVRVYEFVKDFLKYVFSIKVTAHSRTDKLTKA